MNDFGASTVEQLLHTSGVQSESWIVMEEAQKKHGESFQGKPLFSSFFKIWATTIWGRGRGISAAF